MVGATVAVAVAVEKSAKQFINSKNKRTSDMKNGSPFCVLTNTLTL